MLHFTQSITVYFGLSEMLRPVGFLAQGTLVLELLNLQSWTRGGAIKIVIYRNLH